MAGSRLEKIGTIFSRFVFKTRASTAKSASTLPQTYKPIAPRRTSGLLRSGALKPDDKPLWYDVYAAFPPHAEPRFDRPAPNATVRPIFYAEDRIRARYHRHTKHLGATNLSDTRYMTQTQLVLEQFERIRAQGALDEDAIFEAAVDMVREKVSQDLDNQPRESLGLAESFSVAKTTGATTGPAASNVDLKNIFKD